MNLKTITLNLMSALKDGHTFNAQKPLDIIIIGAGVSGLLSGYLLKTLGHRVKILEQTARPGGRILTVRFESTSKRLDGLYAEAGAMRYSSSNHPITMFLIEEVLKLETKPFGIDSHNTYYPINGELRSKNHVKLSDLDQQLGRLFPNKTIDEALHEVLEKPMSLFKVFDSHIALKNLIEAYDHHTVESYLTTQGLDFVSIKRLATLWGVGGRLSGSAVEWIIQHSMKHYQDLVYMKGGSEALITALVQKVGVENIFTLTQVVKITLDNDKVQVHCESISDQKPSLIFTADRIILTQPPAQAKYVHIEGINHGPYRDHAKASALQKSNAGQAAKIVAHYDQPFWRNYDIQAGQIILNNGLGTMVIPRAGQGGEQNGATAIISYAWGDDSNAFFLSAEQRILSARKAIQQIFPEEDIHFKKAKLIDWTLRAGGIGALFKPLELSGSYWHLLRNSGKVYFAGDALSVSYRRWVEGAVRSAFRTVAAIDTNRNEFLAEIDKPSDTP